MLTQDEAELYDRQIRLWGVNAQGRIRRSKVLMLGFGGIASEVAKILVLAGIDTLTIIDDQPLQESDVHSNLFCRPAPGDQPRYRTHQVETKLKRLNPLVKVCIKNCPFSTQAKDYEGYDLVSLHQFMTIDEIGAINDVCRANGIKFYTVLDFGFFGFMFNDLGTSFKFSYEEFCPKKDQPPNSKNQPISLGDDEPVGNTDDEPVMDANDAERNDGELEDGERSFGSDTQPRKKRLRIHSPQRDIIALKNEGSGDVNEKQTKLGDLSYVSFREAITLKNTRFDKNTSPILLISVAMLRYYSQNGSLPRLEDSEPAEDDITKLKTILQEMIETLKLQDPFRKLDNEWFLHIYGSLSPVCAVLGGVAGQDMIRALSSKDIPLRNTLLFDGISMCGSVEKLGIDNSKDQATSTPIVRDVLEIDDDDD